MDADTHRMFTFLCGLGENLRRSTVCELLLRGIGAKLQAHAWLHASVRLWNRVHALPADDPLAQVLLAFDDGFTTCYADLPSYPWQANSQHVSLCTYEQWFAVHDIDSHHVDVCWSALPDYM